MNLKTDGNVKLNAIGAASRFKRVVKWTAIAGVVIFSSVLLVIVIFGIVRPSAPHVDAVIVLGAKVGTPALTQRTLQGFKYYQEGKTDTIVLSGGQGPGEAVPEAEAMKAVITRQVTHMGGGAPTVILEKESASTVGNIYNSKALVPRAKSVVIVSDAYHLARSVLIAKKAGFRDVYWDAPASGYYSKRDLAYYYLREAVAVLAYLPHFFTRSSI
jgi:uncharacterized SAM-binding protein YcdF (DUF218 family)